MCRNTRYAKKMQTNFFCKKNNKSNKPQYLVSCFIIKSLISDTTKKEICLNGLWRMKMVYDQCSPISWLKRKPVTEQTSLSTAHTHPPMSSDLRHIKCTYIFILFLYGSNSNSQNRYTRIPIHVFGHHITHIYFFYFLFVWL